MVSSTKQKERADERTRTADLLITSDRSGVAGVLPSLANPAYLGCFLFSGLPPLHRIAFAVVSDWYQTAPIGVLFSVTWVSVFLVEQTSARWSREPEKRHQLSCHGGTAAVFGKVAGAELRRSAGDPCRGGDARDLVEQLNRQDTAANDDHVLAGKLLGRSVILGVQSPAHKSVRAGIFRDVGSLPRARSVDHPAGREVAPIRFDPQSLAAIANDRHLHGPIDGQVEALLLGREIPRHSDACLDLGGIGIDRFGKGHAGQIVDAINGAQSSVRASGTARRHPAEAPDPAQRIPGLAPARAS